MRGERRANLQKVSGGVRGKGVAGTEDTELCVLLLCIAHLLGEKASVVKNSLLEAFSNSCHKLLSGIE